MSASSGRVAVIGVGNMGGAMAARLLSLGWQVAVRDRLPGPEAVLAALGASVHRTPALAAASADAVIVCVVDAAQSAEVLFGADGVVAAVPRPAVVLLCPTIAPQDCEQLADRLAQHGVACIDAPISGGPLRAREGSMSLMVAAPDAVLQAQATLLAALSGKVFRVSARPGDGARTKLVNNLLAGINLVGAAEVMALAERLGLNLATTLGVIEQSSGQSWIGSDRLQRALAGDYEPRAHMTLLAKDTRLACAAAQSAGFAGPLGEAAAAEFERAVNAGLASEDDGALFKLFSGRLPTMVR